MFFMFWANEKYYDPYAFEKIEAVPKVVVAAWSAYEALRRFGFQGEAIQTIRAPGVVAGMATPYDLIHVVLRGEGDTFAITVGPATDTSDSDARAHERLMNGIRDGLVSLRELEEAWFWSPLVNPVERFQALGGALLARGFLVPVAVMNSKGGDA